VPTLGCIIDRIPSIEECNVLMVRHSMQTNIIEHSILVMDVSLAITNNLKNGTRINRDLVVAAALLHDITKTRSIKTKERHDASGGTLLREMGFISIARIVEQHGILQNFNPGADLEELEIVFYADKRVMHSEIVTLDKRRQDLIERYGHSEHEQSRIHQSLDSAYEVEKKIASYMKADINDVINEIKTAN
jgi:uncharacterized protein